MEFILYEQVGMVGVITINRPRALNALNSTVLKELDATLDAIDLDTTRCLVLTGAGEKSFVAGADIGEMSTLTKEEGEAFGKIGNDVFRKLETFPIPVIAAINGFALGGGSNQAPIAVRACKKAINDGLQVDMDEALVIEEKLFGSCFETEDQRYGMAFFLDKNKEKVKEPFKNC